MSLLFFPAKAQRTQKRLFAAATLIVLLTGVEPVRASGDPDDLYRQGRFAEAEKIYADEDMNRPKDIRFRYNRGCSAYQNGDYQAAMAAFSSVLSRANDDVTRFRAVYNMGNTAYKKGDLASAINYYKQALLYNPHNNDARHNLEVTLREQKKQEENRQQGTDSKDEKQPDSSQGQEGQREEQQNGTPGQGSGESSRKDSPHKDNAKKEEPEGKEQHNGKDKAETEREKPHQPGTTAQNDMQRQAAQSPQDLSGKLEPREAPSREERQGNEDTVPGAAIIDRKKAEALLDNIKEDRARFFRYQVSPEKTGSASSRKDW